jgi:FkbM family methyltransferase
VSKVRSLATWVHLTRHGLDARSALRMRRGRYDDVRFRGHQLNGPDPRRLAWMATLIWGGEYDLPGFVPGPWERVADIGANVGIFSVLAADRGAAVTAFEPHPENFTWLRRNTAPWGVDCRRAAVVGRVPAGGEVSLVDAGASTAHHVGEPGATSMAVPAVSFAELVRERYDLVKLDVEGAEFEIVEATPLDVLAAVPRLVAEVHREAGDPGRLCGRLTEAGLTVALRDEEDDPRHSLLTARR